MSKEEALGIADRDPWEQEILDAMDDPFEAITEGTQRGDAHEEECLPTVEGNTKFHKRVRKLLKKYSRLFRKTVRKEPAGIPPMKFEVDEAAWRASHKGRRGPRPQSVEKDDEIKRQVRLMLELGVIEECEVDGMSQVLLAKKSNGKWRFCIDYRKLNSFTKADKWPLPRISDMLQRIGKKRARWFAAMDMTSGYHQAELDVSCRNFAAFATSFGNFRPTRVAFGLTNAPGFFQRSMANVVFKDLHMKILEMYIDDVLVYARTESEYLENLEKVFQALAERRVTLNPEKCQFCLQTVEFVGHTISADGTMAFSDEKIKKVLAFERPKTAKQLRSFLGLANYFHEHVEGYAKVAAPLHGLCSGADKQHRLTWTKEGVKAFEELQRMIAKNEQLYFQAEETGEVFVETDASDYAIGGVCYQTRRTTDKSGVTTETRLPIRFFSRMLTPVQRRWSTIEKEAYAIFASLKAFEYLIRDIHFVLRTDHRNLKYLNLEVPKVVRWKMAVQEFSFVLEYYPGPQNVAADTLSRLPQTAWSNGDAGQRQEFERLLTIIDRTSPYNESFGPTGDDDGLTEEQDRILRMCHNCEVGHGGVERTLRRLMEHAEFIAKPWKRPRASARRFVRTCEVCQKLDPLKPLIKAHRYVTSCYSPFARISIDTVGPLPRAIDGSLYLLVMIDAFTRFSELYAVKSAGAEDAARCLIDFVGRYGAPEQIVSDNGTEFINDTIKTVMIMTGTDLASTLAYSKEENAIVERQNREVLRHLKAFVFHKHVETIWAWCLPLVQRILNVTPHSATGFAPAELLYGGSVDLDRGFFHKNSLELTQQAEAPMAKRMSVWIRDMLEKQSLIISAAQETLYERDNYHLLRHKEEEKTVFPVNSFVLAAYPKTRMGRLPPTKLHTLWRGPLRVLGNLNNEYRLQNLVTGKTEIHHVTSLKTFYFRPGTTEEELTYTAAADYGEMVVEAVVSHEKHKNLPLPDWDFKVRWKGLNEQYDLWLPYDEIKDNPLLVDYLQRIVDSDPKAKEEKAAITQLIARARRQKKRSQSETTDTHGMHTRQKSRLRFD